MRLNVVCCLLVLYLAVTSLQGQSGPIAPQNAVERLGIVIVEGEGVVHNVAQPVGHDLAVRVEDENHKPVAGAAVAFTLPARGASGTFTNETGQATVMTDGQGLAVVRGLRPNKLPGKMEILILASYKGLTARATVTQFNMLVQNARHKSSAGKVVLIVSLVGAAAAGGAYAGLHKSGPTATGAPSVPVPALIGITPGTGTVGPPQ